MADLLARRGYRPIEFTSVMYKPLSPCASSATASNPRLRRSLGADEQELWRQISARGWGGHPEWTEFLLGFGRVIASVEGSLGFFAHLDGRAGGHRGPSLRWRRGPVRWRFYRAGSTPAGSAARASRSPHELGHCRGCDLAMMCAQPGSASQRNAEREGFRIAYTRIKWQLAPKESSE